MCGVLPAMPTILLVFNPTGLLLLVLRVGVIPVLAVGTL
jgi:hypothetical protein